MPLPLTVSCSSKIQIGFTFLVPAYPGCPGKEAVKWLLLLYCLGLGWVQCLLTWSHHRQILTWCLVAFTHPATGASSFSVAAPKIWNFLYWPLHFRHYLKTHCFQLAFKPTYSTVLLALQIWLKC